MRIDIWSDVACPWCYIGKRRFDVALSRFEQAASVDVRWRSFELDPSAPAIREYDYVEHLTAKYRISAAAAEEMIDSMIEAGARNGVVLRFDRARPGNTFDAHRLLHYAAEQETRAERGVQGDMKERLLKATFTKGAAIGDREVLVALAEDAGFDPAEVREMLASDRFAAEVRADERQAAELGITSVPFFVMGSLGVAGAQPPEVLLQVLQDAWTEEHTSQASS